jgi:serine/threonine-protein kinase RsbW
VSRGETLGTIELARAGEPFSSDERLAARLAAAQLALAIRAFEPGTYAAELGRTGAMELASEALVAAVDDEAGAHVAALAQVAARATGAHGALVWLASEGLLEAAAAHGLPAGDELRDEATEALGERRPSRSGRLADGSAVATLRLGEPPLGVLQLVFDAECTPDDEQRSQLATFAVRVAQALRAGERARGIAGELDRTRALLAVVAQAIAHLSLAHTLDTATERVAELLGTDRVAVYLRENGVLEPAAARGLSGSHALIGERLLELVLGPYRARGVLVVPDGRTDNRLAAVRGAVGDAGIERIVAVPLRVQDDVIGLLAAYPRARRPVLPGESELVTALAAQLAVAVQNARLHEESMRLGAELEQALVAERRAARELRALYEVSGSFTERLSLQHTLDTLARTLVETFTLDAAAIRMPDRRRQTVVTRAVHVRDPTLDQVLRVVLGRPEALADRTPSDLLDPFLAKGATAATVPIVRSGEELASITLLSVDPARPVSKETLAGAHSIAAQAALAIETARLYQQQRDFAETMQRSLRPHPEPVLDGFELGHVYESAARLEVGGDVYDFVVVDDRMLAVVLGDVTGHGIAAAADMALAKFAFRSLVREHPDPSDFLATANEVFLREVELGTFVTMAYLTVDLNTGGLRCATAGHPVPRLVRPDGAVVALASGAGLPLGVEGEQLYAEAGMALEPGAVVVLYTDGVVEARRDGELYGVERLDAVATSKRMLAAGEIARAVVDDCRRFAGEEPADDCAVVVLKRAEG